MRRAVCLDPDPRWRRLLGATCVVIVAAVPLTSARADNTLALGPASQQAVLGGVVQLSLSMDFDDVTLGGAVIIDFDPAILELVTIGFDSNLGDDPSFRCPAAAAEPTPPSCPDRIDFVSFGSFDGLQGTRVIATLVFSAVDIGTSEVVPEVERPFSDPVGAPLSISASAAVVTVVPEPLGRDGLVAIVAISILRRQRTRRTQSAIGQEPKGTR